MCGQTTAGEAGLAERLLLSWVGGGVEVGPPCVAPLAVPGERKKVFLTPYMVASRGSCREATGGLRAYALSGRTKSFTGKHQEFVHSHTQTIIPVSL